MTPLSTNYKSCHNMQTNDCPMMWFGILLMHNNGLTLGQTIATSVAPNNCGAAATKCSLHCRWGWGGGGSDVLWLPSWPTLVDLLHWCFFLILNTQNGLVLELQRATPNMLQQAVKLLLLSPFLNFNLYCYYKYFWAMSLCIWAYVCVAMVTIKQTLKHTVLWKSCRH